jgi:essential nuclear protein 1
MSGSKRQHQNLSSRSAVSLNEQIHQDEQAVYAKQRVAPREKSTKKSNTGGVRGGANDEDEVVINKINQKESSRILQLAKDQLVNIEQGLDDDQVRKLKRVKNQNQQLEDDDSSIDSGEDEEGVLEDEDEEEYEEEDVFAEITEADERAIAAFSKKNQTSASLSGGGGTTGRKTLGEIILERLAEHQALAESGGAEVEDRSKSNSGLNPQVVEVYTSVGQLMTRYRAGKVPKAFKIIPALKDWEQILALTHPEKWSPQAMYQATRLFASNMNPRMAQKFYSSVLLPAVREDIAANRVLNYHHYMSLKKAIYKPASFFKGVLFPLCEEDCTLREAAILGSVLAKVSIPVAHSGVALLKLSMLPYNGATSVFLRILINKKYSLPYKVVDALVDHFCSFTEDDRELPVLWHQALLVFVQRYRTVFSKEQRDRFKLLLKKKSHKQLTPEIRRELFQNVKDD